MIHAHVIHRHDKAPSKCRNILRRLRLSCICSGTQLGRNRFLHVH